MAELIRVKSKSTDRKVILHERDESHPGGEAFLSNDGKVREVAETPAVLRRLGEGVLVKTDEPAAPTARQNKGRKVADLRPATEAEEDAAGLTGTVEKSTARVPVTSPTPAKPRLPEIK